MLKDMVAPTLTLYDYSQWKESWILFTTLNPCFFINKYTQLGVHLCELDAFKVYIYNEVTVIMMGKKESIQQYPMNDCDCTGTHPVNKLHSLGGISIRG